MDYIQGVARRLFFCSMLVIFWMATNWSTTQLFERLARQASSASVNGVSPIQWYAVTVAVLGECLLDFCCSRMSSLTVTSRQRRSHCLCALEAVSRTLHTRCGKRVQTVPCRRNGESANASASRRPAQQTLKRERVLCL